MPIAFSVCSRYLTKATSEWPNDREINLDLIEPAGVHRSVDGNYRGPAVLEALDAPLAAMRRAIVENPKDALGRPIGLLTDASPIRPSNASTPFFRVQRPNTLARRPI